MSRISQDDAVEESFCCPPDTRWCDNHKIRYVRDTGCPECNACYTPDPQGEAERPDLTTLEREVVEKAEEIRRLNLHLLPYGGLVARTLEQIVEFNDAVDALQKSRHPKGVKPSEVAPGTRFRFAKKGSGYAAPGVVSTLLMLNVASCPHPVRGYQEDGCAVAWQFDLEDLILPLDPQEPV